MQRYQQRTLRTPSPPVESPPHSGSAAVYTQVLGCKRRTQAKRPFPTSSGCRETPLRPPFTPTRGCSWTGSSWGVSTLSHGTEDPTKVGQAPEDPAKASHKGACLWARGRLWRSGRERKVSSRFSDHRPTLCGLKASGSGRRPQAKILAEAAGPRWMAFIVEKTHMKFSGACSCF